MTAPPDTARHALCADAAADARVAQDLARLGAALEAELGDALRALLLVGPYARGEGSVVSVDGELQAAGQYTLIALHDGSLTPDSPRLLGAAAQWSALLDVPVRVCPFPAARLASVQPSLVWMDVSQGLFHLVGGLPGQLSALPRIEPGQVPPAELTRLLDDAARDLALARLGPDPDLRHLARAIHHAAMALGDATLFGLGHHELALLSRAEALESSAADGWLKQAYRDAIRYTARPDLWTPPGGERWYGEALERLRGLHLEMEHLRAGSPRQLERLARWGGRLYPDTRQPRPGPWRLLLPGKMSAQERGYRAALLLAYGPEQARVAATKLLPTTAKASSREALAQALETLAAEAASERSEHPIVFGRYD